MDLPARRAGVRRAGIRRPRRPLRLALGGVSVLLGLGLIAASLVGCATRDPAGPPAVAAVPTVPTVPQGPSTTSTTSAPARRDRAPAAAPVPAPAPTAVRIPAIGIDAPVADIGLEPDGTLEVPHDVATAGWYVHRAVPGEPGPAVLAGHVDSTRGPAVFFRLRELEPGARVDVERADGSVARFAVTGREQHDKGAFPTDRVYGPTAGPALRLITCGGDFDRSSGHYEDNVVVFARLLEVTP